MKYPSLVGTTPGSQLAVSPLSPPPDRTSETERRGEARRDERIPVQFSSTDTQRTHQGVLVNDSHGGAFIETTTTLPLLSKIRLEGPGLTCHAVVCRVHWRSPEERLTAPTGMAIRLISHKQHGKRVPLPSDPPLAAQ